MHWVFSKAYASPVGRAREAWLSHGDPHGLGRHQLIHAHGKSTPALCLLGPSITAPFLLMSKLAEGLAWGTAGNSGLSELCCWHLMGRGQQRCQTSRSARAAKNKPAPKVPSAGARTAVLGKLAWADVDAPKRPITKPGAGPTFWHGSKWERLQCLVDSQLVATFPLGAPVLAALLQDLPNICQAEGLSPGPVSPPQAVGRAPWVWILPKPLMSCVSPRKLWGASLSTSFLVGRGE